ncbi:MAG: SUMF1/EgtB/PvdO family nonheme iron enzyme [Reichenbachiella sp.]
MTIVLFFGHQISAATKPESIPSKLKEIKATSWYQSKFQAWEAYLEENPDNPSDWLEYFNAAAYAGVPHAKLETISSEIANKFQDSFEAIYTSAKTNGWSDMGVSQMANALQLSNSQTVMAEELMIAEFYLDKKRKETVAKKLYSQNQLYPSSLNYSYNVLMSVGENGILFTEGESTTIPIWILQDEMNVRQDVSVINLDLAENESYLSRKLKSLDLETPTTESEMSLSYSIPQANPDRDFYFALTLPKKNLKKVEDRLYVVGLTSQLSDSRINNYAILKENIENKFLLDYLTVDFNGEPKTATGKTYEGNYIVPFILLKEHYDQTGDELKSQYWKDQVLNVADRSHLKNRVEMLLNKNESKTTKFIISEIDIKALDKEITKVKDNIYASISETTNEQYEVFLDYLNENGYDDLYQKAAINLSKYEGSSLGIHKSYHFDIRKNTKHKSGNNTDFSQHPAMDMSHEAAKIYCEWLTTQYNGQEKRKFKKVLFRLPTQQEWTMAALGYKDFQSWVFEDNIVKARPYGEDKPKYFEEYRIGDYDSVSYPWYHADWFKQRNRITNDKGCYLANVNAPEATTCQANMIGDGFTFTNQVKTYFSNDMGLFDVIGNVAEMINEPGKAMGGSWDHPANQSTITSVIQYDHPEPTVGFRVFMEVIEE